MLRITIPSLFLLACFSLGAQTSGRITGQILDQTQATIPAAKVTAENLSTNATRAVTTDSQGRFVIPDLPIGPYKVTVTATGFQSQEQTNLTLNVGSTIIADFTLPAGAVSAAVDVSATADAVDPRAANGLLMDNKSVMELPINGRDYARFSLLTPGAVAVSNYIADITFNGMASVHNQYSIDGIDASRVDQPYMANGFERGARLLTGSLDAVEEFRVQTSGYNAEYGRAAGADVRVVTKSGTNVYQASVFEFLRNNFFDARNFFNTKPNAQPEFRYNNFGGNFAGPILKNKVFFFANYEGSRQRIGITGSGTVPSALARSEILSTSPALAAILATFPIGQTPGANSLISNYTTTGVSNVREDTGTIKVDYNFTPSDHVYARFNLNDTQVDGPLFGVTASRLGLTDHQLVPITTTNSVISYSKVFSPSLINEFVTGEQRWGSQINSLEALPQVTITGLTVSPGNGGFSRTNSTSYQYGDTMTYTRGAHTIKFGATAWKAEVNGLSLPTTSLTYTSIQDFINNSVAQATLSGGNPGSGIRELWVGSFVQDTWQVRRGLTVDVGLRYDIGTPNYDVHNSRPFDTRTMTLGTPGEQWYKMNKTNFAPRLGIAWQPGKDGKTVIRVGTGIFFQQEPPGFGSGVVTNTVPGNFTLLRANIPALAYPVTPFLSQGVAPVPTIGGFNWNHPDIRAYQWNFTVIRELPQKWVITLAYVGNHGLDLRNTRNLNLIDPTLGHRPLTQYGNVNVEFDDGQSIYHSFQFSANRRLSKSLLFTFNYTYSKEIDDVQDYGLYSDTPQNMNCLSCDRGPGTNDIRHSASYSVLYNLPFGRGQWLFGNANGIVGKLVNGWQINSLGLIHSGIADLPLIGVNTFGNSNFTNQRPNVVAGVSTIPANQSVTNFWNSAAFSIPAAGTFGNAGRGVLYGPDFWNMDVSLLKTTQLTERSKLEFRAEVFNIFNRPNFDLPYNVVGPSFGQILNTYGRTLGSGTSRQMQMGLKLFF